MALDLIYGDGHCVVHGRWIDQGERPWTDLVVRALPLDLGDRNSRGWATAVQVVRTDEDGRYVLGPLPSGRYRISTSVHGQDLAGPGGFGRYPDSPEVEVFLYFFLLRTNTAPHNFSRAGWLFGG